MLKSASLKMLAVALMSTLASNTLWAQVKPDDISVPFKKHVLKNGLTLLVHEDRKAPIVAVNVWYHVGSKNEKPGRTGFAHLFEHLMFNGSEHFNDDYFKAMEKIGATDLNGTTSEDRTNYFQNVPTSALDIALWMESDRMGHLLGAIDQAKLDEQRGVVQNEKRQGENQPYGKVDEFITKAVYPAGHPYSWTVIGSMEDLNAASLDDVKEWFKTYYGPNNAVLVLAGDIDFETAKQKVEAYFGSIPPGPPIAKFQSWPAKRSGSQRQIYQDRVPQARLYKVWNVPTSGDVQATYLSLAGQVLSSGKTSRLFKRLVYDEQTCTSVSAFLSGGEIGSQFYVIATAKPGQGLAAIEKSIDDELATFIATGPADKELQRVKSQYFAGFIRGIERIGGFGGKSDVLAQGQVYYDNPEHFKVVLNRVADAKKADIQKAAKEWLSDGVYTLEVHPYPQLSAQGNDVDRAKMPEPGPAPDVAFPDIQKAELDNGLKVVLATRTSIPVVNFTLMLNGGYSSDASTLPGTAQLAMQMLDEGTKKRTALDISEELQMLGANLGSGANLDMATVTLSSLKANLEKSFELYADVVLNPSFPEADFQRLKKTQLAGIKQEKVNPMAMAFRVFPKLLYGNNHAYGNPLTGSGYENTVEKLTRDDMVKFHGTWFKPNNATLVVAGNITMNELLPLLNKYFSQWKKGEVPSINTEEVPPQQKSIVYIMDRPGSQQSVVLAGELIPSTNNPDEIPFQMMNTILGGQFTSRINMNLREDKHWSYGAGAFAFPARGQRLYFAYGPVQGDKTKETMVEILKEFRQVVSEKPITAEELEKTKANEILGLPGSWETIGAVGGSLAEMVRFGYADDYWKTYPMKLKNLTLEQVNEAAKKVIAPDVLVWVVVGDRSKIEAGIRELNYGEIRFLDGDGNVVQ